MKYLFEYRDNNIATALVKRLKELTTKQWIIMEVCGGQTHSILQYGLEEMVAPMVTLVHGPGCPVCVTPLSVIDKAITLAASPEVIFCSFGDMLRVPGSQSDLLSLKSCGADIRTVYSPLDCITIAQENPNKKIIFFAIGFETTAPANGMLAWQAKSLKLNNLFLLSSHVLVPPVLQAILNEPENNVNAFLGPGHVCSITGWEQYEDLVHKHRVPIVVTGFEPIDILEGIVWCVAQLESGRAEVENQYVRAATYAGNKQAQMLLEEVFEVCDRPWRGLGTIANSGLRLNSTYADFDAERCFNLPVGNEKESEICISGQILRGLKKPKDCPAFGTLCTPEHPLGATMVSSEGTCANYYKFASRSTHVI